MTDRDRLLSIAGRTALVAFGAYGLAAYIDVMRWPKSCRKYLLPTWMNSA